MKIVITGASGFIGLRLGEKLFSQGNSMRVVTRNPAATIVKSPFSAQFFSWGKLA